MYIKKLIFFLAIFLMALPNCFSQQFTYPWNFYDSTGKIQDMHFMPGDSEFIYTTDGNYIRIRNTETGDLKREWTGIQGKFALTADSQKIVIANGAKIEVRKLSDMSLVSSDSLQLGADSLDPQWHTKLDLQINAIAVDPIKPFAYFVVVKSNRAAGYDPRVDTTIIMAYNYNTMNPIQHFIKKTIQQDFYGAVIDVSHDGKYLAAINNKASYLMVWDLPTLKQIRNIPLYDTVNFTTETSKYMCDVFDMKFSEKNNSNVFYSGTFPNQNNDINGLAELNFQDNSIIDTIVGKIGDGNFIIFDNEKRAVYMGYYKYVLNLDQRKLEYKIKQNYPDPGTWGSTIIYSSKFDIFIGSVGQFASSGIYDRGTTVEDNNKIRKLLFPNPTGSQVTVETDCSASVINFIISKLNGDVILRSTTEITDNKINIDFSSYPNGIYFLTIRCGSSNSTYKVVKEG